MGRNVQKEKKWIFDVLACPICHGALRRAGDILSCPTHGHQLSAGSRFIMSTSLANSAGPKSVGGNALLRRMKALALRATISHTYKSAASRNRIPGLVQNMRAGGRAINIASGSSSFGPDVVNLDIGPYANVDVVASAQKLPFLTGSFDLAILQAGLEHIPDTAAVAQEISRVVRPNGLVYCEVPFMQIYHRAPADYYRFTTAGLAEVFRGFSEIESGVAVGPSSAFSLLLRTYLSLALSFRSRLLFDCLYFALNWALVPIKLFDWALESHPMAYLMPSGVYWTGRRK